MTAERPEAWVRGWLPMVDGARPEGTVTLDDLGDGRVVDELVARLAPVTGPGARETSLTVLHLALGAATESVLAAYVVDGAVVDVAPAMLGAVLRDDGMPAALWVGEWSVRGGGGERVGALLRDLLAPVGSRVAERAGLSSRAVRTVIDDKLRAEGRRLRLRDGVEDPSRVEAVLRGTGFVPRVPQRWVDVTPDGGGVVRLPVPSVCCVLHTRARDSACPTCPKHDPAARTRRTQDWLESLDDAGFREIAGRERVIRPGGSGGGVGARG
jgi:hypothetical protein